MTLITRAELQASATIAKTTQTLIGAEILCGHYDTITLFVEYTRGDETGWIIQAHYLHTSGGTEFQDVSWSAAAGTKLATVNEFKMTATVNRIIVLDVRGIEFVKFTQGGSNNDGTPTGTFLVNYVLAG